MMNELNHLFETLKVQCSKFPKGSLYKKETFNEFYLRKNVETLNKITIDYIKNDCIDVSLDALSNISAIYKFISKKSQNEYLIRDISSEVEKIKNFSMSDEKYKTVTQKCNEFSENAKGNE